MIVTPGPSPKNPTSELSFVSAANESGGSAQAIDRYHASPHPVGVEQAAKRCAAGEVYPFSAGSNGGLSAPHDFQRFLSPDAEFADPTAAELAQKTETLLLPYLRTAQFGEFPGASGVPIRYAVFAPPAGVPVKGRIVVANGRTESISKYSELFYNLRDLRNEGYVIAMCDHRGQGWSGRELSDPRLGHVQQFSHYVDDLEQFCGIVAEHFPGDNAPTTIVAHSTGGAVATLLAQRSPGLVHRLVLMSPMVNLNTHLPDFIEREVAALAATLMPTRQAMDGYFENGGFEGNDLAASPERFDAMVASWSGRFSETYVAGFTWRWLSESIAATERLRRPSNLAKLHFPGGVSLFFSPNDSIVDPKTIAKVGRTLGLSDAAVHQYPDAKHELLSSQDSTRNQVLQTLKATLTA